MPFSSRAREKHMIDLPVTQNYCKQKVDIDWIFSKASTFNVSVLLGSIHGSILVLIYYIAPLISANICFQIILQD
jgi:hypothetical protein